MSEAKYARWPVGFVNKKALRRMLSGESAQCKLSRMKCGRMTLPLFDRAAESDLAAFVAEFIEAWDAGMGGDSSLRDRAAQVLAKATGATP